MQVAQIEPVVASSQLHLQSWHGFPRRPCDARWPASCRGRVRERRRSVNSAAGRQVLGPLVADELVATLSRSVEINVGSRMSTAKLQNRVLTIDDVSRGKVIQTPSSSRTGPGKPRSLLCCEVWSIHPRPEASPQGLARYVASCFARSRDQVHTGAEAAVRLPVPGALEALGLTLPPAWRTPRPCRCCRASAASRSFAWCRSARPPRRRRACRRTGCASSRRSRARPWARGWAR